MVLVVHSYDAISRGISQVRARGASHVGLPFGANLLQDRKGAKNDRCRAKRDSIARAPREKRRGGATRIYTAGCMPYFCTHKTQQCWTQNAPHKWIKQLRALAYFTILPYFFTALFCFSGGGYSSQHSDPVKKAGAVCTQNLGAVSRVVTLI